ncbi:MAG: hypothetical protein HeimC2_27470 [Candidatus Heimdallarchaeota archaeon LC_2]|nr:MAG: hypothetical protein HeimC2_27470 [Candidatus Heimdallarchaeota archaeon LC_2]
MRKTAGKKMKKAISFFGISLIFLLLLSNGTTVRGDVEGDTDGDTTTVQTDGLVVEIKGGFNVPFYFFWSTDSPDVKYKIQMDSIFEANDSNINGVYDLASDKKVPGSGITLASLTWEFSDLTTETNSLGEVTAIDFSLNTAESMNPTIDDTFIQFDNHIDRDSGSQLKFDVIIDNYEFSSPQSMLVLAFKIQSQGEASQDGQTVSFGDGFFHSENTASDDNGEISVGLSQANEDGGKLYLAYEQFTGKMIHDPTIGVGSSPDGGVVEDTDQNLGDDFDVLPKLSKGSLITPTILATIVFLGIPVIIYSVKRNS